MDNTCYNLHETLRELRKSSGLNQTELSELIGLKRPTYAYYELGKTRPDIETIAKIAKVYNISIDDLVFNKGKKNQISAGESEYDVNMSVNMLSATEKELLIHFRLMNVDKQKDLLKYAKKNCDYKILEK